MSDFIKSLYNDLKNDIKCLEDEEYVILLDEIRSNIRMKKQYTVYKIDMYKSGFPDWCPLHACYNIMKKLRSDKLVVHYKMPNILMIEHPRITINSKNKNEKVMNFLYKENASTIRNNKK